jgi:hypothetical protein
VSRRGDCHSRVDLTLTLAGRVLSKCSSCSGIDRRSYQSAGSSVLRTHLPALGEWRESNLHYNGADFYSRQETPTPAPFAARFIGAQSLSGTLPADGSETATAEVWVDEPGLVSLDGWYLAVETGDELQDASLHEKEQGQGQDSKVWRPRFSWTRRGEGGTIDVMQA